MSTVATPRSCGLAARSGALAPRRAARRAAPARARAVDARGSAARGWGRHASGAAVRFRGERRAAPRAPLPPARAEQSAGKKVASEDAVAEAGAPGGEPGDAPASDPEPGAAEEPEASLGDQIRELKKKQSGGGGDPDASNNIVQGALEEVGQIEWPTVGSALQTTGIVIGIVTGSAVVLLGVNSVLAAASQSIFGS